MLGRKSCSTYLCTNSIRSSRFFSYFWIIVFFFWKILIYLVPPSIDQVERHYTGFNGQSIKLSCQANGIPIPTITWRGIYNVSGTAIVDSFGNLYIDRLEWVIKEIGKEKEKKT